MRWIGEAKRSFTLLLPGTRKYKTECHYISHLPIDKINRDWKRPKWNRGRVVIRIHFLIEKLSDLPKSISKNQAVWPDWLIYWTFGNFSKPVATISLPKSPTILGNFCAKIFNFYSEIIWATFTDIWRLFTGHTETKLHFALKQIDVDDVAKQWFDLRFFTMATLCCMVKRTLVQIYS